MAQGCQYDPFAHLFTTTRPDSADVVGHYILVKQTVCSDGLSVIQGKFCAIEIRADGTFVATNVPPRATGGPGTNFFASLLDANGRWRIDSVGGVDSGWGKPKTHWGIYLDATEKLMPVGLTGQKPPYGLIYTLGDPDGGQVLMLERAK